MAGAATDTQPIRQVVPLLVRMNIRRVNMLLAPNSRLLRDAYESALLRRASFSAPKPGR